MTLRNNRENPSAGGAPRDREVIALVGLAHGTSHFFHLLLPPLFPWLMRDFSLSYTDVGLLTTTFFVISGIGQALAGFVVDRVGGWRVLCFGVGMLALSGIVLGLATSYPWLMLSATFAGLGNSIFHPSDFTILNQRVSQPRLGHAFSIHGVSGNVGWAVAPIFMAGVTSVLGWHVAGFGAAALGTAVFITLCLRRRALADAEGLMPSRASDEAHQRPGHFAFLASGAVWLSFAFFLLTTMAFGVLQNAEGHRRQEEKGERQPHGARCQKGEMSWPLVCLVTRTRWHQAFRICECSTPQTECDEDRCTKRSRAESRDVPTQNAGDARHEDRRNRPPDVARDAVDRKRVSQTRLTHPLIEDREIGWMEDAVAETGERRTQHQPGIAGRQAQHDAGERQHPDAEAEDPPATHAIDDEAGQRLSDAADHEERRREQSDVGVAEREIAHQPREQRRQQQMEEVRGAVREPDERDDLAVSRRSTGRRVLAIISQRHRPLARRPWSALGGCA